LPDAPPILLDALGTLLAFEPPAPRLRALLAQRFGVEVTLDEASVAMKAEVRHYRAEHDAAIDAASLLALRRDCAGVLRDALPERVRPALGGDELVATLVDAIVFAPYPETREVLRALRRRGHPLAIVSNWDVSLLQVLGDTGLDAFVDEVVVSALVGASKPDPRPFAVAFERLGVDGAGALHVGDTLAEDVAGARAAGVRPVLVVRDGAAVPDDPDLDVVADLRGVLALAL
jgi:putative hydrolase of the HAD superfamily